MAFFWGISAKHTYEKTAPLYFGVIIVFVHTFLVFLVLNIRLSRSNWLPLSKVHAWEDGAILFVGDKGIC